MLCWVISLYGAVVGIWWIRLRDYFVDRGLADGIDRGGQRLAAVALTGHVCDITMGMALLPISRHSALASFFKIAVSTTLTNHMLTAYTLFVLVIVHGLLYASWVPVFKSLSSTLRTVIPVLNPTYLYHETWPGNRTSLGRWRASLIFTGITAAVIMSAIFITTLPAVRRKHFNLFYFTHLLAIVMVIIICLHASTMFYCTAPGLAMWTLDWGMRLYELRRMLNGEITTIGNGWYCVSVTLPRSRLTGCSCRSPLAHFYIHHAGSSIRELHPFTTVTHLASKNAATPASDDDFMIQFLFRKQGNPDATPLENSPKRYLRLVSRLFRGKKQRIQSTQWTQRLAGLVDQQQRHPPDADSIPRLNSITATNQQFPRVAVSLRLEGPYFSPADPSRYEKVICFVAGTGISGALAIATAFTERHRSTTALLAVEKQQLIEPPSAGSGSLPWRRCIIVWSVKATEEVPLPFINASTTEGLELKTYPTGPGRDRVDMRQTLAEIQSQDPSGRTWVYISGPKAFITAGEGACKAVGGVDIFAASWEI